MTSRIIHILTAEAREEHNPYKWELAVMLYALQSIRHTDRTQADNGTPPTAAHIEPLRQDTTA